MVVTGTSENGDTISVSISDGTHMVTAVTTTVSGGVWSVPLNAAILNDGPITYTAIATNPQSNSTIISQVEEKVLVSQLVATVPVNAVAGSPFSFTVAVEDQFGNIDTTFNGNVTISMLVNPGGSTEGNLTAQPLMVWRHFPTR